MSHDDKFKWQKLRPTKICDEDFICDHIRKKSSILEELVDSKINEHFVARQSLLYNLPFEKNRERKSTTVDSSLYWIYESNRNASESATDYGNGQILADRATCVSNSRIPVARGFFPAKVARIVSFCLEQGIGRRLLNTSIPTASTVTLSPSSSIYAASNLGRSDLSCPLLDLSFTLFLSPSFFRTYGTCWVISPRPCTSSPPPSTRPSFPPATGSSFLQPFIRTQRKPVYPCIPRWDAAIGRGGCRRSSSNISPFVCKRVALTEIPRPSSSFTTSFSPRSSLAFSSPSRTVSTIGHVHSSAS